MITDRGAYGAPRAVPRPATRPMTEVTRGLCGRPKCPMLLVPAARNIEVADLPGDRGEFAWPGCALPDPPMHRLIAKLMLLVLLAGTFAPLAGAMAIPASHDHCMRTAPVMPADGMPACHHHVSSTSNSAATPDRGLAFRSNQCCSGHACCRSLVRSQCAQVCLRITAVQTISNDIRVFFFHQQAHRLDLTSYFSGRSPPPAL